MRFSTGDLVFEGFRLVRRKPMVILAWTLVYLLYTVPSLFVMTGVMETMAGLMEEIQALEGVAQPTPEQMAPILQGYGQVLGRMVWLLPFSLLVNAVLLAAVSRAVLTPEAGGFGYLRLGRDEARVFVLLLVAGLLTVLATVVAFFIAAMLGGLAITAMGGWGALVLVAALIAAAAFIVWLAVRWSLAVPIIMTEKRLAIFESFALTRGVFWPLLGMAVIVGLLVLLIGCLSTIVAAPISLASGLSMAGAVSSDDPAAMLRAMNLTSPWMLVSALVNAVVYALTVGVIYAPFSAAYLRLKGVR